MKNTSRSNNKTVFAIMLIFCIGILTGCSFNWLFNSMDSGVVANPIVISENAEIREVAASYLPATVSIIVENKAAGSYSIGSGVAVYAGGYIATNYHVVADALGGVNQMDVYPYQSEIGYASEVLWSNVNLDLAIIKCSYTNIPYGFMEDRVLFCDKINELKVLEPVIAIGTPLDMSLRSTVTLGYVNSLGRRAATSTNVYEDVIQHQAPINHGNSGGPLIDNKGKIVGLNTMGNDNANDIYFAVPIYPIIEILPKVVAAYEKTLSVKFLQGTLGISGFDKFESKNETFDKDGFKIKTITAGGASFGKLAVDDIICGITVNGVYYQINDRNDMIYALIKTQAGDSIVVKVNRLGFEKNFNITLN
ncbi:MAG: S1C family serine protease [Clostridia bacterium]